MSIKNLSEPVRLEQLAEECAELGHAALKLARILIRELDKFDDEDALSVAVIKEIVRPEEDGGSGI